MPGALYNLNCSPKDKDDSFLLLLTLKSRTIFFNAPLSEKNLVRQLIFSLINDLQFTANLEFKNGWHKFTSNFENRKMHLNNPSTWYLSKNWIFMSTFNHLSDL